MLPALLLLTAAGSAAAASTRRCTPVSLPAALSTAGGTHRASGLETSGDAAGNATRGTAPCGLLGAWRAVAVFTLLFPRTLALARALGAVALDTRRVTVGAGSCCRMGSWSGSASRARCAWTLGAMDSATSGSCGSDCGSDAGVMAAATCVSADPAGSAGAGVGSAALLADTGGGAGAACAGTSAIAAGWVAGPACDPDSGVCTCVTSPRSGCAPSAGLPRYDNAIAATSSSASMGKSMAYGFADAGGEPASGVATASARVLSRDTA